MCFLNTVSKKLLFLILLAMFLSACGGGGAEDTGSQPTPTNNSVSLLGGGVKGPLAHAVVTVYLFDSSLPGFKGNEVATALTGANSVITGLEIPLPLNPPYIMEIDSILGSTVDITTGLFPVVTTLRTVITQQQLDNNMSVYATPLTLMATELAVANADSNVSPYGGDNNGATTTSEFLDALPIAASQVVSTVGFGLGIDVDIFNTPPLVNDATDTTTDLEDVSAYRSAIEALTAVVYEMSQQNIGSTPDDVLNELASDLADGNGIDGSAGSLVDLLVLQQNPSTLPIPNSPTNQTVADVQSILAEETATTGTTVDVSDLVDGISIITVLNPISTTPDIDADGVADELDNCPLISNSDQNDFDGNGVGDLCDTPITYYLDGDGDGYGNTNVSQLSTTPPQNYVLDNTDCDDSSTATFPGAMEVVDGADNNCNGQIDEGFTTYYNDGDGDGYGNPDISQLTISQPDNYVTDNTDCDDSSAATFPGAVEVIDGVDNDCDGQIDEDSSTTYYLDLDGDGFGNSNWMYNSRMYVVANSAPTSYVSNDADCNDTSSSINPSALEIEDNIDNNCDGLVDEGFAQENVNHPPTIQALWKSEYRNVNYWAFNVDANDFEDGVRNSSSTVWHSNVDGAIGPGTAFFDGDRTGSGNSSLGSYFFVDNLTPGIHLISVVVTDSQGASTTGIIEVEIKYNQNPVVEISSPESGSVYSNTDLIVFSGAGTDLEDGDLSGESLAWTSDVDGEIGFGQTITTSLSVGTHRIVLRATDSNSDYSDAYIRLDINSVAWKSEIDSPSLRGNKVVLVVGDTVYTKDSSGVYSIYNLETAELTPLTPSGSEYEMLCSVDDQIFGVDLTSTNSSSNNTTITLYKLSSQLDNPTQIGSYSFLLISGATEVCHHIGSKLYFVGGVNWFLDEHGNEKQWTVTLSYDPTADSWGYRYPAPTTVSGFSSSVVNGKIYIIGGSTGSWLGKRTSGIYEYDSVSDTWASKSNMLTARRWHASAAVNGMIYVFGGDDGNNSDSRLVEEYNPITNVWSKKSPMPTGRRNLSTAVFGELVYVIGGVIGNSTTPIVESYEPALDVQ